MPSMESDEFSVGSRHATRARQTAMKVLEWRKGEGSMKIFFRLCLSIENKFKQGFYKKEYRKLQVTDDRAFVLEHSWRNLLLKVHPHSENSKMYRKTN